jgi:hypothetical protein
MSEPAALERHLSPDELANAWGLSTRTIRRLFQDEPGVLKIGQSFRARKRGHVTLRIPVSVAERVRQERSAPAASRKKAS